MRKWCWPMLGLTNKKSRGWQVLERGRCGLNIFFCRGGKNLKTKTASSRKSCELLAQGAHCCSSLAAPCSNWVERFNERSFVRFDERLAREIRISEGCRCAYSSSSVVGRHGTYPVTIVILTTSEQWNDYLKITNDYLRSHVKIMYCVCLNTVCDHMYHIYMNYV